MNLLFFFFVINGTLQKEADCNGIMVVLFSREMRELAQAVLAHTLHILNILNCTAWIYFSHIFKLHSGSQLIDSCTAWLYIVTRERRTPKHNEFLSLLPPTQRGLRCILVHLINKLWQIRPGPQKGVRAGKWGKLF